jgi:hypothetical protein
MQNPKYKTRETPIVEDTVTLGKGQEIASTSQPKGKGKDVSVDSVLKGKGKTVQDDKVDVNGKFDRNPSCLRCGGSPDLQRTKGCCKGVFSGSGSS